MQLTAKSTALDATRAFLLSKMGNFALLASLASYVFDAPLRFALSIAHIESALYLRDVVFALIVAASLIQWMVGKSYSKALIPLYLISLHFFWGLINLPSILQPIVGLKILLTYLAGVICYETYEQKYDQYHRLFTYGYLITAASVIYNYFLPMPWVGMSFASATGDVNVSKEWYSGGIQRIAGFARSSTETSAILAMLCAPLITSEKLKSFSKFILYCVTLGLIIITTTKGGLIAWLVIGMLLPLLRSKNNSKIFNYTIWFFAAIGIAIPALIYIYDVKASTSGALWILSSFADRVNRMWPGAFANTQTYGSLIFGRGLGGIGFPQSFGEGNRYNSADSVMVYVYVTFGLPGILYTFHILKKFTNIQAQLNSRINSVFLIWLLYWFIYGTVGNDFETPLMLFFAGIITGAVLNPVSQKNKLQSGV